MIRYFLIIIRNEMSLFYLYFISVLITYSPLSIMGYKV